MSAISASSALSSLLSSSKISVGGLATGLDSSSLIQGLLAIDQQRITNLQTKSTGVRAEETAFKGVEARLLSFQGQVDQLARSQNGVFDARTVDSSDPSLVTAAADPSAQPGSYQIHVGALAQANQIISQGFESATSDISQGTFQLRVGGNPTTTINVGSGNNTLQGLADAVNAAGVDVVASVVQDGTSAERFRLLLSSSKTGTANAISLTNNLAADSPGLSKPVFSASYVGAAEVDTAYSGSSIPTSNRGAGLFTGAANNAYTFTVLTNGAVGSDDGLQIAYRDSSGSHTGTLTLNAADAGQQLDVAEGVKVAFSSGTLVAGQKFTVKGYVPVVQEARDAEVTIGTGAGALTVHNATNQLDHLFTGVSLSLLGADPAKTVTVTVSNDVTKAKQAVQNFVSSYNDLMSFIDDQVSYNPATQVAGTLLGDRQATAIQDKLRDAVGAPVVGLKPQMNRLSALGVTTNTLGKLVIDDGKLTDALSGNVAGVSTDDIRRLFALTGTSSQPGISFVTGGTHTKASATPFQVTVTSAASQASIAAGNTLAASAEVTDGANTFGISVDGSAYTTITVPAGSYTRLALAQELESQINSNTSLSARHVNVALDGDKLSITSSAYGSGSRVSLGTGPALSLLGFSGTENGQGSDVAGYFTVNGATEAATGSGQILSGASGNTTTADLRLRVSLTADQIASGGTSNITVTRGIASTISSALNGLLDPVSGRLTQIDAGFQASLDDIQNEITRQTDLMSAKHDALVLQFTNLETTVSQLQSVSNMLSSQLGSIGTLTSTQKKSS